MCILEIGEKLILITVVLTCVICDASSLFVNYGWQSLKNASDLDVQEIDLESWFEVGKL